MASIKNLKKDINYVLGDIIEECYAWELLNPKADTAACEKIIDDAIEGFDTLIDMIHLKNVENKKAHFKNIEASLEAKAVELISRVNKL
ncbi:hypothetical protein ACFQ5N_01565 [Lutibacter holmesii]|uniref:MafI family immunity protein n=1 Tax=Lutibacter holmesii TaxID=1137985 RepID=A0ABW3WJR0_9FLAO